MFFADFMTL